MADWDGEGYEQISDLQRTMAERSLSGLTVRGDERCLDVGCGDGYVSRLVADRLPGGSVLGIDASPRMIEAARSAPVPAGATLSFRIGDALDLRFGPVFDLVLSFNALHWVVDQSSALRSIAGSIRLGGRAVLQYVCSGPRPSLEGIAMQVCREARWQNAFSGFAAPFVHVDPAGYQQLALASGLQLTSQAVHDESWQFAGSAEFRRWCTVGFADWTARLSPNETAAWVDDVVDRYESLTGMPGLFRFYQLIVELEPEAPVTPAQ